MATTLSEAKGNDMSAVDALWVLIQKQTKSVRKALIKKILEEDQVTQAQKSLVKESLTQAFDEFHSGQVKHNARRLFAKTDT